MSLGLQGPTAERFWGKSSIPVRPEILGPGKGGIFSLVLLVAGFGINTEERD